MNQLNNLYKLYIELLFIHNGCLFFSLKYDFE